MTKDIEVIDLFCGIGGLSYGLKQAGLIVKAGLDSDASCKHAYERNIQADFIEADIANYDMTQLKRYYSGNSIKVLVGCAPCQPFSTHSHKIQNKKTDKRWNLINYFVEAVKVLHPDVISMENVRGLTKTNVFEKFIEDLIKLDYKLDYDVIFCPNYGIPQNRSRFVLLGSLKEGISIMKNTHSPNKYRTVLNTIGNLPPIRSGEICKEDTFHKSRNLSDLNLKRIKQSKPSGTWRDWDKNILPDCYKKESGQTYSSVYGRMSWEKPSPTITTQFFSYGSGRFGHPEQDRALSFREGALLQTFPPDYDFGEISSMGMLGRQIGNAVPPHLGFVIGKLILEHSENIS